MELPGENLGGTLHDKGEGEDILKRTSFAQEFRPPIDKWDLIKLKRLFIAKEIKYRGSP